MALGAAIGSIGSGLLQARSANRAADAQSRSAAADRQNQREMYDQTREDLSPYRDFGNAFQQMAQFDLGATGAAPTLADGSAYGGFEGSPGYQFQRNEGINAIDASAAARGMLRSGGTMQAQQQFGTGLAQQDYANHIQRLMQGAGVGLQASGQQIAANQNFAQGASNTYAAQGNAQAAGIIGQSNAISNGLSNLNGLWAYQQSQGQNMLGGPSGTWGFS